jgi:internalin A
VHLDYSQVADISSLANLQNVWEFTVSGSQVTDLSPIREWTELEYLGANGQPGASVSSIAAVSGMHLKSLSIQDTAVSDFGPLSGMGSLVSLDLRNSALITDLHPLANVPLTILYADGTSVTNWAPVAGVPYVYK